MGRPAKDLTGKVFGALKVIERDFEGSGPGKAARWTCECDCGNKTTVSSRLLGKIKSCGCQQHKYIDLINKKFNMLLVTKKVSTGWKCLCDCGKTTVVGATPLVKGNVKSCGCYNKSKVRHKGINTHKTAIIKSYKNGASKRKLEWGLSEEVFFKLLIDECNYCGSVGGNSRVKKDSRVPAFEYTGIDRVENDIGYIESNCVSCCKICNRAKSNLTLKDFRNWIAKIKNS